VSLLPDFIEYPESQVYSTVVPGQYVSIKSVHIVSVHTDNVELSPLGGFEQTGIHSTIGDHFPSRSQVDVVSV